MTGRQPLIRIAITPEYLRPDESSRIMAILDAGWDYVHLRSPGSRPEDIERVLKQVDAGMRSRIVIHDYFHETWSPEAGGIHLNRRNPEVPAGWLGRISRSCHCLDDIADACSDAVDYDYLTLSPVFASRSKQGYAPAENHMRLVTELPDRFRRYPIVALGGITPSGVSAISAAGFAGYAVLGYLAEAAKLEELYERLSEFELHNE